MDFDETPRFWYPHVALDAWIGFSSRTVELRSKECRENLPFCFSLPFLSLSLSLSLYPISFPSSPCLLHFIFLFFSFPISTEFFFPFFLFLFYFFFFLFSFGLHQPNGLTVGETFPHFPPLPLVITTMFLLISLNFFSLYFPPLTHGSM